MTTKPKPSPADNLLRRALTAVEALAALPPDETTRRALERVRDFADVKLKEVSE